jgi:hypothetical protein
MLNVILEIDECIKEIRFMCQRKHLIKTSTVIDKNNVVAITINKRNWR